MSSSYIKKNYVEDKVVIITGASSGFGRLTAMKVAEMGGIPVIGARREDQLKAVADEIEAAGGKVFCKVTDVTKKDDMVALANFAVEKCGRIDTIVNNAGTMPLAFFADHKVAMEKWEKCIDTNFKGTLYGICAVYDQMMKQEQGQIINVSSIYSNYPVAGSAVYQATKIAVKYLSDSLRVECKGKIKVSTIKPTGVGATGLTGSVVNQNATIGFFGHMAMDAITMSNELPGRPDLMDQEAMSCFQIDPGTLADNIIFLINQPWGINISDITVRGSNEPWIL